MLARLDAEGAQRWRVPSPVGYGRGLVLACGEDEPDRAWVLGPHARGTRAARVALDDGRTERMLALPRFDRARVREDLVLAADAERVFALDLELGELLWERRGPGRPLALAVGPDVAALAFEGAAGDGSLWLVEARDGEPLVAPLAVGGVAAELELDEQRVHALVRGRRGSVAVRAWSAAGSGAGLELWERELLGASAPSAAHGLARDAGCVWAALGALLVGLDPRSGRVVRELREPALAAAGTWLVAAGRLVLARERELRSCPLGAGPST